MKSLLAVVMLLCFYAVKAQNEFAVTAFYNDFKKIYTDAQAGFESLRGTERKGEYPELQTEYNVKLVLTGADSGKLVFPAQGVPYAVYYFPSYKNRLKTDQESLNLREAMITAYGQVLYVRTETIIVNNRPFSNTWFFGDPNETATSKALFRTNIYYKDEKYYLVLEIRGKAEPA